MPTWHQALSEEWPDTVEDHIGVVADSGVVVITLSRPEKKNALNRSAWLRLQTVLTDLAERQDLRAVVVRGAGGRDFGAGADIAEFPQLRMTAASATAYNEAIAGTLRAVAAVPVPVIAMVRGLAVGGGCELASACDVRVAGTDARFGIPVGKLGVILGYTEARALAALIGRSNLKHLLFEGGLLDAAEALRIGLAQVVVEPDALLERTTAMVEVILRSSPVTMRAAKLVVDMCDRPLTAEDADVLTRLSVEAYEGPHLREGVAAFLERRPPSFAAVAGGEHVGA